MELDEIAAELYQLPPHAFTVARDAKAAEARAAGERATADAVKQLRRSSVGAWLANVLSRRRSDEVHEFLELGVELRRAQERLAGDDLRRLARRRQELVTALSRTAETLAADSGEQVTPSALAELQETLEAALADESTAALLAAGLVTKAMRHSGLGPVSSHGAATPSVSTGKTSKDSRPSRQIAEEARQARADLRRAQREREQAEQGLERIKVRIADLEDQRRRLAAEERSAKTRLREAHRAETAAARGAEKGESALRASSPPGA